MTTVKKQAGGGGRAQTVVFHVSVVQFQEARELSVYVGSECVESLGD